MPMPASTNEYGAGVRIWIALLLLGAAAILFVALCLILEEWQVNAALASETRTLNKSVFISQPALIVYCTILAGVLGSAVRILGNRLSMEVGLAGAESVGAVAAQVFLGGAFAFAAGFLLPHALATNTISNSYNVWSLMIVGGFAGYASTGVAVSVHKGLQGLIAGLRQGVAEAIVKEEVSRTIAQSARDAMALPEPVAYAGIVEMDITDENDITTVQSFRSPPGGTDGTPTALEGPRILLKADTTYLVRIRLVPRGASRGPRPTRPIALPIDIEGLRAPVTPLDVRVDYGFPDIPVAKHAIEARIDSETELPPFAFRTPSVSPLIQPDVSLDSEPNIPPRLTIAVLQNNIPYVRRQLPLELDTGESPAVLAP